MGSEFDNTKQRQIEKRAMPVWQQMALKQGSLRSCVNCFNFTHDIEGCKLANNTRPPAMIVAIGCDKWEMDIPF